MAEGKKAQIIASAVEAVASEVVEGIAGAVLFRLRRRFWDGERMHGVGSLLRFVPGSEPRGSSRVED